MLVISILLVVLGWLVILSDKGTEIYDIQPSSTSPGLLGLYVIQPTTLGKIPWHPHNTLRWRHNDHAGVSNHQPPGCLLNRLFRRKSKKTSKLRVTGLCAGNSPGTGEFSAQMASYAENVSIWWRHHEFWIVVGGKSGWMSSVWMGVIYVLFYVRYLVKLFICW